MQKRMLAAFSVLLLLFCGLISRLAVVAVDPVYADAARQQSTETVEVASMRGTIYDRNFEPLVNTVRTPVQGEYAALLAGYKQVTRIGGSPLAVHTIGVQNAEGVGVSGLEAAYDTLLRSCGGTLAVRNTLDAKGRPLAGASPEILSEGYDTGAGLVLTLDAGIQRIAEQAADSLDRGAVVVMDPQTGDLLALVSRPAFDPRDMGPALSDARAPFVNRAFASYSVGSTFKILVCAAALDAGISPSRTFACTGSVEVDGLTFHCHNRAGHGALDMTGALERSCNPYFITLALELGGEALRGAAQRLGFGTAYEFAPGMRTSAGSLPDEEELRSSSALANFGFGQGKLLASPIQIACLVSAAANGGAAVTPRLVLGTTGDGATLSAGTASFAPVPVFSQKSADEVRRLMVSVVKNGSGKAADPGAGGAGGKTASAQTGQYENGSEIVHAWFAGFYPAENPRYTIVVFAEGGDSGSTAACPIFREIAKNLEDIRE